MPDAWGAVELEVASLKGGLSIFVAACVDGTQYTMEYIARASR